MDPASQSIIVSTLRFSFLIEISNNCKKPQLHVESIEGPPVLFSDKGSSDFLSFSVLGDPECKSLLCFLVHPFTPHTLCCSLSSNVSLNNRNKCKFLQCFVSLINSLLFELRTHPEILWSPSFNGHCFVDGDVDLFCSLAANVEVFTFSVLLCLFFRLRSELHCHFIVDISYFIQPFAKYAKISMVVAFALRKETPLGFQFSW